MADLPPIDPTRLNELRAQFERWQAESAGLRDSINTLMDRRDRLQSQLQALQDRIALTREPAADTGQGQLEHDMAAMDRTLAELGEAHRRAFRRWQSLGRLIERCERHVAAQHRDRAA